MIEIKKGIEVYTLKSFEFDISVCMVAEERERLRRWIYLL